MHRRSLLHAAAAAALLPLVGAGLGGCAAVQSLSVDVSSYGGWPADRRPGSYAFDRLPSQQLSDTPQIALEDALRTVLARAGFTPVAAGAEPDLLVQAGARVSRADRAPWDDPLWWPGGFGVWRHSGPWRGPGWGFSARWDLSSARYEREVAVLLRDRASGKPLYEARATSEGYGSSATPLLAPLFEAGMSDFPNARPERHTVTISATAPTVPAPAPAQAPAAAKP